MPVGKPTPDGAIIQGSRKYAGAHGSLGLVGVWQCPACGRKVEGSPIEQGCPHCGAGSPANSKAGAAAPRREVPESAARSAKGESDLQGEIPAGGSVRHHPPAPRVSVQPDPAVRIVRLIEYLIKPGADAHGVLRNSLVGTMTFAWGQLTATIVDSVDLNQEDRLRLAKLQPGVWLAHPEAMAAQGKDHPGSAVHVLTEAKRGKSWDMPDPRNTPAQEQTVEPPDTGPAFSPQQHALAVAIVEIGGYRLAYTLALGLQGIAEELNANAEPEKFLTSDEALELANALMAQIPADWNEVPPPAPTEMVAPVDLGDAARRQEIRERMKDGATPTPVFREVKSEETDG